MPKPRRGNKRATTAAAPAAPVAAMEKLAVAEQAAAPASPLEQAFTAVAAACKGAKTFEGAAATAVDAFNAETLTVETFLAVDGVTILKNELLCNKKNSVAREAGLKIVESLIAKWGEAGVSVLITTAKAVLNLIGDKRSKAVRELAPTVSKAFFDVLPAAAVPVYVNECLIAGDDAGLADLAHWQTKMCALKLLIDCSKKAPRDIEAMMTSLVPVISSIMWDSKAEIRTQAADTLEDVCDAIDNVDLEPFIPAMVEAIQKPETVADCVYALAGTTFVQTVTASALSITVPILERGFKEPKTAIKRKCAVITENMAKLVKNPADVAPFLPIVMPLLTKGMDTIADPECRQRFTAAQEILTRVSQLGAEAAPPTVEVADLTAELNKTVTTTTEGAKAVGAYVVQIAAQLVNVARNVDKKIWAAGLVQLLTPIAGSNAETAVEALRVFAQSKSGISEDGTTATLCADDDEDDPTPDLCDLQFSLAYGSNILLNNSRLHLKKGYKYGIIATKSAGKTTMMRAISNNQVEGFPYKDVRTIFIENDIQGSQMSMNVVEFLLDTMGFDLKYTPEEARAALLDADFTEVMCSGPITSLSGGWKMKLALVRATMQKADIMLMDEPTNHLDVINVQWVVDYINSLPNVTCLMVSHDTGFLDKTVDHIIHFADLKLHTYKGNISAFVARFPEAKSYFELGNTGVTFKFPQPGLLEGVRQKGTAIMSMTDVSFAYPGAAKNQLNNVTVRASMASRVAIVGANGAGKSTMIKLLTGELKPSTGIIKKHPNCRFAYVAQHAFHHIEQHLEKSPNEYIRWRYEGGEDKEARRKVTANISEEEKKIMEKPIELTVKDEEGNSKKEKRVLEKLMARRKEKKDYSYEVKWKGKTMDQNTWHGREFLEKRGFIKIIKAMDDRMAAASAFGKPLTSRNVEEHLGNVGLEAEYATHCRIGDLSGGQKVKVVLAACTWACPHLIILDEPTNYLDRDSLGALANAIKDFEGGIVLITHNKEFADATTRVTWVVANNRCDIKGDAEWEKYAAEMELIQAQEADTRTDAFGNTTKIVKIKTVAEMSRAEVKKNKKLINSKIKNGEELEEHEMDWADEWNIKFDC